MIATGYAHVARSGTRPFAPVCTREVPRPEFDSDAARSPGDGLLAPWASACFQPHAMCSSRAGQLSFTFMLSKQAVLAEPSEPTTARRAAPVTPASRESSRSPDRLPRALLGHTASPDHGCARQEFANPPNTQHISLDCHRGGGSLRQLT